MSVVLATGDRRRDSRFPGSVIGVSVALVVVAAICAILPSERADLWRSALGFVPSELAGLLGGQGGFMETLRLLSALFVHNGMLHLCGNLAYLWVFGIPVERALGSLRFLFAFLLLGGLANASVVVGAPELQRLVLGASGGVSVVVGLYLGLFPTRRIGLWLPLGVFLQFARIPALLVIGSWFTLQLLYSVFGPISGEVAWWTHVAGFVAGVLAAVLFRLTPRGRRAAVR